MIYTRSKETPIVVGFTGTQRGPSGDQLLAFRKLLGMIKPISGLHHGDCIGWDAAAHEVFDIKDKFIAIHPPINPSKRANCVCKNANKMMFSPKEYLDRNHGIVDATDILIACPSEEDGEALRSGTWSTVRYARKNKSPIIVVRPSGRYQDRFVEKLGIVRG